MTQDRRTVLDMLAAGQINAGEAERLLAALEAAPEEPAQSKKARYLRVVVDGDGRSDASARGFSGITATGCPHPRTYGTFPRVFGRLVRGRPTPEFAEAIPRITSLPAAIFGLAERGTNAVGASADLVPFAAEPIVDTATYERPVAPPRGIAGVWVNGRAVARNGVTTGALPGRVLRAGR